MRKYLLLILTAGLLLLCLTVGLASCTDTDPTPKPRIHQLIPKNLPRRILP